MRMLARIFSTLFYVEIALILVLVLVCFAGLPFGFKNYAVTTGSMVPTIDIGSMVYVNTNISGDEIDRNDIVAFYTDDSRSAASVHRAIAVDKTKRTITTKGDANDAIDPAPIPFRDVIGRIDLSVPYLGYIADAVASRGILVTLVIAATAALSFLFAKLADKRTEKTNPMGRPTGIERY